MEAPAQNWLSIPSRRELADRLERTDMSADAKVIIAKLLDTTAKVGAQVFEIGKQIIAFAFDIISRFRGIAFGAVIAVTVSTVIASTPLIGGALAAILTPLLLAFGLTMGALEDLRNGALREPLGKFQSMVATAAHD
ncbi:hypothetical protein WBP06_18360 (plasmid) [Novosphingobium sp. BL-8H]|uniref:hypothetical protein n=1 Tax=Novosphingobium sp. BL-8H TaxID=3127640 RepID=UPI00375773F1